MRLAFLSHDLRPFAPRYDHHDRVAEVASAPFNRKSRIFGSNQSPPRRGGAEMRELDEELSLIFTRAEAGNGHVFQLAVYPPSKVVRILPGRIHELVYFLPLLG